MKVYVIPMDGSSYITNSLPDAIANIQCELEDMEAGDSLEVEVSEMTREEFEALPDFS